MIIRIDANGVATLLEPEDFRAFSIAMPDTDAARAGLAAFGRLDGQTHAWVAPGRVRTLAGSAELPPDWDQRYAGMVAYAAGKGWTDEHGALRAHIVYD